MKPFGFRPNRLRFVSAMHSVTLMILSASVMNSLARELPGNHAMDKPANTSMNQVQFLTQNSVDKLTDELVDRLLGVLPLQGANLDGTTYAKAHPVQSFGLPHTQAQARSVFLGHAPSYSIDSLPGPSAMKRYAISKIEATNGRCLVRDVSRKASMDSESKAKVAAAETVKNLKPGEGDFLTKAQVKEMAGVTAPFPNVFDPFGFSTKYPEGNLLYYRAAELKHGRVCMLATLGIFVGEKFHPLFGGDIDVPAYLLGTPYIQQTPISSFWPLLLGTLATFDGLLEFKSEDKEPRPPGDYGWDPLGIKPRDEKAFRELQNKELNNGRLAMLAASGIIAQEMATGQKVF